MIGNEQSTSYSCKCINIQLRSQPPPSPGTQSDLPPAPEWMTVFVPQDEDIKIVFPHLTLRSRHRGPYIPDPTRCARYTTVTCLSCQTLVYRIHQVVSFDDEANIREGPIVTKVRGWAETEVLRSSSGWLEVSIKDVLVGEIAISRQKSLSQFSELFGIVLPSASPSPSLTPDFESTSQSISQSQSLPKYQLPPIPAIFPEPKSSTRSLFTDLAAIATRHSNALRSEAEEHIDCIVKEKVEEIKRAEAQLKRNVLALLTVYSDGIKKAEQEQQALQRASSQTEAAKESVPSPPVSPSTPVFTGAPSSVVRDFVPMRITPSSVTATVIPSRRSSRPPSISASLPRVSALSASLATSSFHHPKARNATADGASTSPPNSSRANISDVESLQSFQSASSTTLTAPQDLPYVFQFRQRIGEDVNTAASFRYFQLEEEMKKRELESAKEARDGPPAAGSNGKPLTSASSSKANGTAPKSGRVNAKDKAREVEAKEMPKTSTADEGQSLASPKFKGKRKVTFDVQVDPSSNFAEDDATNSSSGDMLFDYEEETNGRDTTPVVLPLKESASQHSASGRPRLHKRNSSGGSTTGGLPESFSALRPDSLPAPSHISLPIPSRISPTTSPLNATPTQNSLKHGLNSATNDSQPQINPASGIAFDSTTFGGDAATAQALKRDRHAQILNLLAASLPSHRAAWAGKNYETFVRGAYANEGNDDDEESEDDDGDMDTGKLNPELLHAGIPSSVPVTIHRPKSKSKVPPLSLASYQPDAVITDNMTRPPSQVETINMKRLSSAALRRASYAERDVERGVDPGMFDYLMEVHQEEDENEEDVSDKLNGGRDLENGGNGKNVANGPRQEPLEGLHEGYRGSSQGRDRAYKILEAQAKSGVPDDEMWRSLI
ncbi:hypothetical protein J3R30DRAFT_3474476 [Lentinula aciculospora]|uniref:Uncharacterized protein n=1 Tax=Lentinula aciculospora TaxID=153920 RepID=A0A9W9DNS0_9AGAR|nr:hypothetical protein J3R30DRAFT_3474476 [Lentinula aciculospora]